MPSTRPYVCPIFTYNLIIIYHCLWFQGERTFKNLISDTDSKIKKYEAKFQEFKLAFQGYTTIHTGVTVLHILDRVDIIGVQFGDLLFVSLIY